MSTLVELKTIADRARFSLIQDAIGAAALIVMLVVGLHLPVVY